MIASLELRLKPGSGQDRGVKRKIYARETDKSYENRRIYSPISQYNQKKCELTKCIEQTKSNAGAFVDEMKRQMDGGIKNLSNNMAFELFGSGTATRGVIGSAITNPSTGVYQFTLQNPQNVVQFEVGMTIQASATDGGAVLPTLTPNAPALGLVSSVNRSTGVIQFTVAQGTPNSTWAQGNYITVQGDIPPAGGSGSGPLGSVGSYLAASGLSAWVPATDPSLSDSYWGVNRSVDPTRLAGLRFNASSYSIEEGVVNALGFANREGADPDTMILSFQSYTALENALGAKVQYVDIKHEEANIAFEGIRFHSAYGYVTVFADRSCQPLTGWCLSMDKQRVHLKSSLIDLEIRQDDKGQAKAA